MGKIGRKKGTAEKEVCGKLGGNWKRGSPTEGAVLGMNRVRRCEFSSARRIPLDPTPGADGSSKAVARMEIY